MSSLITKLRRKFQDEDYRHSYAEECLNTMIASQIKVLRDQREMTQGELAEKTGMRQPRLSVLEDASYSSWSINTLKRLARAFDVALSVRFESFSDVILDFESLSREFLERPAFKDDPLFSFQKVVTSRGSRRQPLWSGEAQLVTQDQRGPGSLNEMMDVSQSKVKQPEVEANAPKQNIPPMPLPWVKQQGEMSNAASISRTR